MLADQERVWWQRPDVMWPLVIGLLFSVVVAFVATILLSEEAQRRFLAFCRWFTRRALVPTVIGVALVLFVCAVWFGQRMQIAVAPILLGCAFWLGQQAERVHERRRTKKEHKRWDNLGMIKYGHLEYGPLLHYNEKKKPLGLAINVLTHLLTIDLDKEPHVRVDRYERSSNWSNVFQRLFANEFAVIATPVFATYERSRIVRFSSPLFFSNVGLYVSQDAYKEDVWKNVTVSNLKDKIDDVSKKKGPKDKLTFLSVEGEISDELARKYGSSVDIDMRPGDTEPNSLFKDLVKDPNRAFFCESFTALIAAKEMYNELLDTADPKEKQRLLADGFTPQFVNVLQSDKILYPVCFAVRVGDYHLANLLNIRLLDFMRSGRIHKMLVLPLAEANGLTEDQVREHFVTEWPLKAKIGGAGEINATA